MSESIEQARVDLVAALRLAVRFDLHEGIDNHFSYALPGMDDRFLLHPYGLHWSEVTAGDMLVVDQGGRVRDGEGEVEVSAFAIHSRIHRQHPRARCVLHTHMPYATALTAVEAGASSRSTRTHCGSSVTLPTTTTTADRARVTLSTRDRTRVARETATTAVTRTPRPARGTAMTLTTAPTTPAWTARATRLMRRR